MPGMHSSVHVTNILGLVGFLILWIGFFECAKLLIALFKLVKGLLLVALVRLCGLSAGRGLLTFGRG